MSAAGETSISTFANSTTSTWLQSYLPYQSTWLQSNLPVWSISLILSLCECTQPEGQNRLQRRCTRLVSRKPRMDILGKPA